MSSKSINVILSYTVSKLVRYFETQCSAERGIAVACCLSVRLFVRLSVCNVGGL